jgi:uncharacterized spore protein YtfJ
MVIQELVKTVLKELREISKTQTVVGEPIVLKEVTIVPVSKVSLGFGIGGGEGETKRQTYEGTGGGIAIEPQAFIVVRKDKAELITLQKSGTVLGDMIELVPKVLKKVRDIKSSEQEKKDGESS